MTVEIVPPPRSCRTMLLSRSLMSSTWNCRSTLASPSTSPRCSKKPTPELNSTTLFSGSASASAFVGLLGAGPGPSASQPAQAKRSANAA